jgi:hypothetical protein
MRLNHAPRRGGRQTRARDQGPFSSLVEDEYRPMIVAVIVMMMMQLSGVDIVRVVAVPDRLVMSVPSGLSIMRVTRVL